MTRHTSLDEKALIVAELSVDYMRTLNEINKAAERLLIMYGESATLRLHHRGPDLVRGLRMIYQSSLLPEPLTRLIDLLSPLPTPGSREENGVNREEVTVTNSFDTIVEVPFSTEQYHMLKDAGLVEETNDGTATFTPRGRDALQAVATIAKSVQSVQPIT